MTDPLLICLKKAPKVSLTPFVFLRFPIKCLAFLRIHVCVFYIQPLCYVCIEVMYNYQ